MRIAEIFRSLQGEGRLAGADSIFVRTSGCNLRCRFCDTPYASWVPEGDDLSVDEIVARIDALDRQTDRREVAIPPALSQRLSAAGYRTNGHRASPRTTHVVLTGGEPMLCGELTTLCDELRRQRRHITIETSGTIYLPVDCDLMSISPKLSNSTPSPESDPRWTWRHESSRYAPDVVRRLVREFDYQIKFVIDTRDDCQEAEVYLSAFPEIDRSRVMLMPQGTDPDDLAEKAAWLGPYCEQHGLEYCPRWQVAWFNAQRGT
jgi:7-carboxy-7-deazaguanine synthase